MTMSQRILYMRTAYLFILESDTSKPISFHDCCKKSIEFYQKMSGFNLINNPRILMNWKHEKFPHPNYRIEMGKDYAPLLLETFPETKMKLKKWISRNVGSISCESVANKMRTKIIPKSVDTYERNLSFIRIFFEVFSPQNHLYHHNLEVDALP